MTREPLDIGLAIAAVLLLAAGGAWLVDHAREPRMARAAAPAVAPAGARLVTLDVAGMTCAKCASRITNTLLATPGVRACGVDPRSSRAWVVCDRGLADTSLVAAVVRSGAGPGSGSEYAAKVITR
jgi:copper chaperone CopZ